MKIKAFEVIAECGNDVYKMHFPGTSRADVEKHLTAETDLTPLIIRAGERRPDCPISAAYIADALAAYSFGQMEIDLITRTLTRFTDFVE